MNAYPAAPGWKESDGQCSETAARAVESKAKAIRDNVEAAYKGSRLGMTSEECAALLRPQGMDGVHFERFKNSVGSRVSELKKAGLLDKTTDRRANATGLPAAVFRHRCHGPTARLLQEELL